MAGAGVVIGIGGNESKRSNVDIGNAVVNEPCVDDNVVAVGDTAIISDPGKDNESYVYILRQLPLLCPLTTLRIHNNS